MGTKHPLNPSMKVSLCLRKFNKYTILPFNWRPIKIETNAVVVFCETSARVWLIFCQESSPHVHEKSGQKSPFQIITFANFCAELLVTQREGNGILSEMPTFRQHISEISGERKTKCKGAAPIL